MPHECQCESAGHCPVFGRRMTARHHQICSGRYPLGTVSVSESVRRKYVDRWAAEAGREAPRVPPPPPRLPPRPRGGPGTELRKLISSLGLSSSGGCNCGGWASEMDRLGVAGCLAQRDRFVARLRQQRAALSWREALRAAALSVATGLAFRLNPSDPAPGLFEEAVRRAAAAQSAASNQAEQGTPPAEK